MSQIKITVEFTVDEDDVSEVHRALHGSVVAEYSMINRFSDLLQQAMYDEGPQLEGDYVITAVGEVK